MVIFPSSSHSRRAGLVSSGRDLLKLVERGLPRAMVAGAVLLGRVVQACAHFFVRCVGDDLRLVIHVEEPEAGPMWIGMVQRHNRKMLAMSQTQLADALGISKCRKTRAAPIASERAGCSKSPTFLQVPVAFCFEGAPNASAPHGSHGSALSIAQIDNFVSDSNGFKADRSVHAN
jgi:hypothetical protein